MFSPEKYVECYKSCPHECLHHYYDIKQTTADLGQQESYEFLKSGVKEFENKSLEEIERYFE